MSLYKRAKGRQKAYDALCGRDKQVDVNRKPRLGMVRNEVATPVYHSKGLSRPSINYAKKIAKARNDDFYGNIRVVRGV